ncbi:MAG: putative rane protein [Actinomycetospora sp.]|nr:putative rane protein [Actinomycetospora sp.]
MKVVEVRAVRGRAMVAGVPLGDQGAEGPESSGGRTWGLPPDLVDALQEWARTAASVGPLAGVPGARPPAPDPAADAVSRRGRHLAARVSVELAVPVDYCDPVTGHRVALRAVTRTPYPPPVPLPVRGAESNGAAAHPAGEGAGDGTPTPAAAAAEPTPWGTGLVLAVLVAGLVLLANLALATPLITGLGVLGLVVDVAVVAGLVPALWLNRHVPTWRWAVYGTFAGTGVALLFLAVAAF